MVSTPDVPPLQGSSEDCRVPWCPFGAQEIMRFLEVATERNTGGAARRMISSLQ